MTPEQKFQIVQFFWDQFPVVLVRARDCDGLPPGDPYPKLRLHFPKGLQIPDLLMDLDGFSATLLFGGRPREVKVPWSAVLAVELDGGIYVTFPPCHVQVAIPREPEEVTQVARLPRKGGLSLIKGGKDA
jgi:hypothetical protein